MKATRRGLSKRLWCGCIIYMYVCTVHGYAIVVTLNHNTIFDYTRNSFLRVRLVNP